MALSTMALAFLAWLGSLNLGLPGFSWESLDDFEPFVPGESFFTILDTTPAAMAKAIMTKIMVVICDSRYISIKEKLDRLTSHKFMNIS